MKQFYILPILLLLQVNTVFANESFDQRFNRACVAQYSYLKSRGIDNDVLQTLTKMKDYINDTARRFGVDPRVIAGAILTEHSLNTSAKDIAENFLVKTQVLPTGELFGKKFTYGFGQLHYERAATAESIAAKVEGRRMRSQREISDAILSPEGSIEYIAALLKQEQDMYSAAGYPINNDPGVTATLYNIGKIEQRIARTRTEKRMPEPNYFGCYVEQNMAVISKAITSSRKINMAANNQAAPAKPAPLKPNGALVKDSGPKDPMDLYTIHGNLKLSNGPAKCYDEPAFPVENKPLVSGDKVRVLNRGVSCDLDPWVLVQNQNGVVGWISQKTLGSKASKKVVSQSDSCAPSKNADATCSDTLKNGYANFDSEISKGLLSFKADATSTPTFAKVDLAKIISQLVKKDPDEIADRKRVRDLWKLSDADFQTFSSSAPADSSKLYSMLNSMLANATNQNSVDNQKIRAISNLLINARSDYYRNNYLINYPMLQKVHTALSKSNLTAKKIIDIYDAEVASYKSQWAKQHNIGPTMQNTNILQDDVPDTLLSDVDNCDQAISKFAPDSQYMWDGIRLQISKYLSNSSSAYYINSLAPLFSTCSTISLSSNKDLLDKVQAINPNCDTVFVDRGDERLATLAMQLPAALSALKTDEDKRSFLVAALTNGYNSNGLSNTKQTQISKLQFANTRDLINSVSQQKCINTVYVNEPWLASRDNAVYIPMKDSNTVEVETSFLSCGGKK